ncbi:Protein of unknown function [Microlunatus sagamiharensis]|uniref:DUF4244 domain-containing protein n=1 Tax=Microlunatus sagamiharensis TaxID=546874 RepID=A0A1H2NFT0_9ACTN|nr:DUF4244 domain-containing protein [Microlunatus sagamiharensis]SDV03965.1 Protein of unknown function [Microlunatus sagamiharensis]
MEQVQDAGTAEGTCAAMVEEAGEVRWAPSVPLPGRAGRHARGERGMVSAEWAVGIVAAVAIAGVLLAVVTTGAVKAALLGIVLKVLSTFLKFAH